MILGSYDNNPMIFPARDFNVSKVQFQVDGRNVLPEPYEMDWKNNIYEQPFHALMKTMGIDRGNAMGGSCINYTNFGEDYGIFATKIRGFEGKNVGSVSIEVFFNTGPQLNISALVFGEFRSVGIVHKDGTVEDKCY